MPFLVPSNGEEHYRLHAIYCRPSISKVLGSRDRALSKLRIAFDDEKRKTIESVRSTCLRLSYSYKFSTFKDSTTLQDGVVPASDSIFIVILARYLNESGYVKAMDCFKGSNSITVDMLLQRAKVLAHRSDVWSRVPDASTSMSSSLCCRSDQLSPSPSWDFRLF